MNSQIASTDKPFPEIDKNPTITNIFTHHCRRCGAKLCHRNKSGICRTCLLIVHHYKGQPQP